MDMNFIIYKLNDVIYDQCQLSFVFKKMGNDRIRIHPLGKQRITDLGDMVDIFEKITHTTLSDEDIQELRNGKDVVIKIKKEV